MDSNLAITINAVPWVRKGWSPAVWVCGSLVLVRRDGLLQCECVAVCVDCMAKNQGSEACEASMLIWTPSSQPPSVYTVEENWWMCGFAATQVHPQV